MASQLAAAYDELRQQCAQLMSFTEVRTDPLTGVSNRRALDEALAGLISLLNRYESGVAIVILDIDHFKKLNDEQGHLYGDEILTGVARLMDENVRDTDQVARYGGEEFVILMPYTNLAGAAQFANRLRERLATALPVTISAGVAVAASGDTPQTLVARADAALYLAKQQGRNRSCVHDGQRIASFAEFAHFAINLPEHQPIRPAPRGTEKVAVHDQSAAMLEQREAKTPEAPRHSEMPVSQHSPGRDLRPTAETQREQLTERSPAEINLLELGGKPTPPPMAPILESETRS
jgi:diguanylate cyclase (GGDEF)-like protein